MRTSAPSALASSSVPVEPGHAHHVAEAGEDHARLARDRDAVVDAAHRDHADRAAGPVDELDVLRQQVVDAVLVDRVGVPAADLHQLVVAARLDGGEDLAGERRGRARRRGTRRRTSSRRPASRRRPACDRRPGVDQQRVAGLTGVDQRDLHRALVRRPRRHRARARGRVDPQHRASATPSSEQVMQCVRWRRSVTRSRSPSAPRAPARTRRPSASQQLAAWRCASSSSIFEIAKPTWISTQSPGLDRRRAGRR